MKQFLHKFTSWTLTFTDKCFWAKKKTPRVVIAGPSQNCATCWDERNTHGKMKAAWIRKQIFSAEAMTALIPQTLTLNSAAGSLWSRTAYWAN